MDYFLTPFITSATFALSERWLFYSWFSNYIRFKDHAIVLIWKF
jgi:hypothetical protein